MHYVGHRASQTNPLRSIPLFRPASILRRPSDAATFASAPALAAPSRHPEPTVADLAIRELANAEAALREAERVYDGARAGIGEANRTHTAPMVAGGRVIMAAQRFTAERMRERKSAALRLFNKRRAGLSASRRRVDAARATLGLPSLAECEARASIRADVRASKRQPVHQGA